jgi:hypothetical protein
MASALCWDAHSGSKQERRYFGIFKIRGNQTKESAGLRRQQQHNSTPVQWLSGAVLGSVKLVPLGHVMGYGTALIQEAILTAQAMGEGGPPCRGGPWSHSNIGSSSREEVTEVQKLIAGASDLSAARKAVGTYATGRPESSYLKMHCENKSFRSDSGENFMGAYKERRASTSGKSQSGCQKRKRAGLKPGTLAWEKSKWASDWKANKAASLAKRSRVSS